MKTCPKCGKKYSGRSAMSRIDKKDICPTCGTREAMEAAGIDPESQTYKSVIEAAEAAHKQSEEGLIAEGVMRAGKVAYACTVVKRNITGPAAIMGTGCFRGTKKGKWL